MSLGNAFAPPPGSSGNEFPFPERWFFNPLLPFISTDDNERPFSAVTTCSDDVREDKCLIDFDKPVWVKPRPPVGGSFPLSGVELMETEEFNELIVSNSKEVDRMKVEKRRMDKRKKRRDRKKRSKGDAWKIRKRQKRAQTVLPSRINRPFKIELVRILNEFGDAFNDLDDESAAPSDNPVTDDDGDLTFSIEDFFDALDAADSETSLATTETEAADSLLATILSDMKEMFDLACILQVDRHRAPEDQRCTIDDYRIWYATYCNLSWEQYYRWIDDSTEWMQSVVDDVEAEYFIREDGNIVFDAALAELNFNIDGDSDVHPAVKEVVTPLEHDLVEPKPDPLTSTDLVDHGPSEPRPDPIVSIGSEVPENPLSFEKAKTYLTNSKIANAIDRIGQLTDQVGSEVDVMAQCVEELPPSLRKGATECQALVLELTAATIHLATLETIPQLISFLALVIARTCGKSICATFVRLSKRLFKGAGDSEPQQSVRVGDMISAVANNKHVMNLVKLIGMSVCVLMSGFTNFEFDFALFKDSSWSLTDSVKATDFMNIFSESVGWFADVGYQVFTTRSLRPIFFNNPAVCEIIDKHKDIVTYYDDIKHAKEVTDTINLGEYIEKTEEALERILAVLKVTINREGKQILYNMQGQLRLIHNAFISINANTKMKAMPFTFSLFGPAGVGKSTINDELIRSSLVGINEVYDRARHAVIPDQGCGKFDSVTLNRHISGTIDDFGQTKPEFIQQAPTSLCISIVNNVPALVNKADVNEKGCHNYNFKVFSLTTNVENLNAPLYTMEPEAILRRFIHVDISVKKHCRIPGTTRLDPCCPELAVSEGRVANCWWLRPKVYMQSTFKHLLPDETWKDFHLDDEPDRPPGYFTLRELKFLFCQKCRIHHEGQQRYINSQTTTFKTCKCGLAEAECACPKEQEVPVCDATASSGVFETFQFSFLANSVIGMFSDMFSRAWDNFCSLMTPYEWRVTWKRTVSDLEKSCMKLMDTFVSNSVNEVIQCVPSSYLVEENDDPTYWDRVLSFFGYDTSKKTTVLGTTIEKLGWRSALRSVKGKINRKECFWKALVATLRISVLMTPFAAVSLPFFFGGVGCCCVYGCFVYKQQRDRFLQESTVTCLIKRQQSLGPAAQAHLHRNFRWISLASKSMVAALAGIALYKIWVKTREVNPAQFMEGDLRRDRRPGWFDMFGLTRKIPVSDNTTTLKDLPDLLAKKMVMVEYSKYCSDKKGYVRGLMIKNNVLLCVKHLFTEGNRKDSDFRPGSLTVYLKGGSTKCTNSFGTSECIYQIGDKDLVLVYLHRSFNCKEITNMFTDGDPPLGQFKAMYSRLGDDCRVVNMPVTARTATVGYRGAEIDGYLTEVPREYASVGSCGSLLTTSDKHGSTIHGVVFATKDDGFSSGQVHFCPVTKNEIITTLEQMRDKHTTLASVEEVSKVKKFGQGIMTDPSIHPKSILKDVDSSCVHALGTRIARAKYTSKIRPREISKAVEFHFGIPCTWSAPQFKGEEEDGTIFNFNKAYNVNMHKVLKGADKVDERYLDMAEDDYIDPLLRLMKKWKKQENVRPLTTDEMINGVEGKRFLEMIKMATSMGLPNGGIKKAWFEFVNGKWQMCFTLSEEFKAALTRLANGDRHYAWFQALLKDEAKTAGVYKVRVFYSCDVVTTLLVRKYYLPIMRFLQFHNLTAEIAVGLNPMSDDWQHFIEEHAKKFLTEDQQCFGLDYSHYDAAFSPNVFQRAVRCFERLAEAAGYSEDDLLVMRGLREGLVSPVVAYNGTVITACSMHASGNPATVIINSIVNCLLIRSYYYSLNLKGSFRDSVAIITYGDDVLGTVKEEIRKDFNFIGYRHFLNNIGMEISHPSKGKTDSFHSKDMDFLKRKSVYHEILGMHLGAIEYESIFRSLHMTGEIKIFNAEGNRTGNTEETTTSQAIDSAMAEFALHGEEIYNTMQKKMLDLLIEFPDIHNQTVKRTYTDRMMEIKLNNMDANPSVREVYVTTPLNNMDGEGSRSQNPSLDSDVATLNKTPMYGAEKTETSPDTHMITFSDDAHTEHIEVDDVRLSLQDYGLRDQSNLGEFLKRPVQIANINWSIGSNITIPINPMETFFANNTMRDKLRYFRNFYGKMKLKFLLNGNPFYYGRIIAAWKPMEVGVSDTDGSDIAALMQLSTRMHCMLNPTDNSSPTMSIPFFFPNNSINMLTTRLRNDTQVFGTLELRTLNELRHANGSSNPVEITIMMWFEEFSLGAPTASSILPAVDEREGKVEKIATKTSRAIGLMSDVPVIGPYATALEKGSMALAKTAKLFGWSKPERDYGNFMVPQPIADIANGDGMDDVKRLVLDSKQGLSIDPSTVGLPREDELAVSHFVKRESYLTTILWSPTSPQNEALFRTWVDPALNNRVNGLGAQYAPCGLVAGMHEYWTGSMKFRLEVVCSAYHKGRLSVAYDARESDNITASADMARTYLHVMDISECTNMTFEVGWAQAEAFRRSLFGSGAEGHGFVSGSVTTDGDVWGNGFLTVAVRNSLVTPSVTADPVYINVYISGGDDMMFAAPTNSLISNLSSTAPPGTRSVPAVQECEHIVKFVDDRVDSKIFYGTFGETTTSLRTLMKRYNYFSSATQELNNRRISTFLLPMMPTMSYWRNLGTPATSNWLESLNQDAIYAGYCTTPMSLLGACFTGCRGGVRWMIHNQRRNEDESNVSMSLWRLDNTSPIYPGSAWGQQLAAHTNAPLHNAMMEDSAYVAYGNGAGFMDLCRNQTLKIEIPFYSYNHFSGVLRANNPDSFQTYDVYEEQDSLAITTMPNVTDGTLLYPRDLFLFQAIAEDFNLFWFQNVPVLYRYEVS